MGNACFSLVVVRGQLAFKHGLSCCSSSDGSGNFAFEPPEEAVILGNGGLLWLPVVIDYGDIIHRDIAALWPVVGRRRLWHAAVAAVVAVVVAAIVAAVVVIVAAIVAASVVGVGGLFCRLALCPSRTPIAQTRAGVVPVAHLNMRLCHFFKFLCDLLRRLVASAIKNKMYKCYLGLILLKN